MQQAAQPSIFEMLLPFVFIFVIFYFLVIRPQGKKIKEHEKFVKSLKRGDSVITNSGILGVIDGLTDSVVTLEIAPNTKIKILRKQIASTQQVLESASTKKQ